MRSRGGGFGPTICPARQRFTGPRQLLSWAGGKYFVKAGDATSRNLRRTIQVERHAPAARVQQFADVMQATGMDAFASIRPQPVGAPVQECLCHNGLRSAVAPFHYSRAFD